VKKYYLFIAIFLGCFGLFSQDFKSAPYGGSDFLKQRGVFSSLSDSQTISLSAGMFTNMKNRYAYSMLSTNFKKSLNSNWTLNYGVDYLNLNGMNNFANGSIGAAYTTDKFRMEVYFSKTFNVEETSLFNIK